MFFTKLFFYLFLLLNIPKSTVKKKQKHKAEIDVRRNNMQPSYNLQARMVSQAFIKNLNTIISLLPRIQFRN